MRDAWTVQTLALRSISDQGHVSTGPMREAVRIVNSRARAEMPLRSRNDATKDGTSAKGKAS